MGDALPDSVRLPLVIARYACNSSTAIHSHASAHSPERFELEPLCERLSPQAKS